MHRTLLLLAVVLTTSCVRADVVYNNLGPGDTFSASGRILIGPDAGVFSDVNQAASFSVGPTAHHLTDVVLGLGVNEYPVKPFVPSLVNVHIAADAAGSPGTVLLSLPYSIITMGDQAITVQDAGSLLLAANTDYWVIADAEGEFNGSWRFNDIGAMGLTAGQTAGNAWNLRPDDDMYALRIGGTPFQQNPSVPEPSAILLALLSWALVPRRHRNRSA
jgi:hypothetical protein